MGIIAATLKKIAELAGVSIGTVDRALKDKGRVNPEVAKRIKEIAEALDYRSNSVAKSLAIRNKGLKIGVVLHIDRNLFYDDVLDGIHRAEEEIRDFGISVMVKHGQSFDVDIQLRLIDEALADGASALAIVPINHPDIREKLRKLSEEKFPVVFLNAIIENTPHLSYVGCNYPLAGRIAAGVVNMVCSGTGKVLAFSPSFQMLGHIWRMEHLKRMLETEYPRILVQQVIEMSGDDILSYNLTKEAFKNYPDTDVLVCSGAVSVNGTIQALKDIGRYQKLKIVVYDFSEVVNNGLIDRGITAAITYNPKEQGYRAIKILFEYLAADNIPEKVNYIDSQIILRESIIDSTGSPI